MITSMADDGHPNTTTVQMNQGGQTYDQESKLPRKPQRQFFQASCSLDRRNALIWADGTPSGYNIRDWSDAAADMSFRIVVQ